MIPDKVIIDREKLINMADAIRIKTNSNETLTADEIAEFLHQYTTDANAIADNILVGYSAYSNNQKIEGNIEVYNGAVIGEIEPIVNNEYLAYLNNTFGNTYKAPEGALNIPGYAFYLNTNIEYFILSSTVLSIGNWCCRDAKNLKSVFLNNGLKSIGLYSFYNCELLEEIIIPETVTTIGAYSFYGCKNLKKINIPDGITLIGNYLFYNCFNLKSVELPAGIVQINNYALTFGQDGDATLIINATKPPTISNLILGDGVGKIIVPKNCLSAYQNATNWSAYANLMEENNE